MADLDVAILGASKVDDAGVPLVQAVRPVGNTDDDV
jgi:hypothetical protein